MDAGFWALVAVAVLQGLSFLGGYLQQGGSFPQPLAAEEEQRLLARMRDGDPEARALLIEHNLRLVAHIVKKFDNTGEDADDLISIGTIGLIKGINTYDPEKGTRLATYAARCIENEILMHLRSTKRLRSEVSLYDPIGEDREGNELTLLDILHADEEALDETIGRRLLVAKIYRSVRSLSKRERTVLEMRFGLNGGERMTQRQVARKIGISRSYVSRIEKRAVRRLCEALAAEGLEVPAHNTFGPLMGR